jgi:hypothetical protein
LCPPGAFGARARTARVQLHTQVSDAEAQTELEDNFRTTIGQLIGSATALIGGRHGLLYQGTQETVRVSKTVVRLGGI